MKEVGTILTTEELEEYAGIFIMFANGDGSIWVEVPETNLVEHWEEKPLDSAPSNWQLTSRIPERR